MLFRSGWIDGTESSSGSCRSFPCRSDMMKMEVGGVSESPNDYLHQFFPELAFFSARKRGPLDSLPKARQYVPNETRRTCGAELKFKPQSVSSPFQLRIGRKMPFS